MFGRATITLGIGPHSSSVLVYRPTFVCAELDCDIVQIAALYGNKLFSRYVWPLKPIHPRAFDVHKISVDERHNMYVGGQRVEHVERRRAMTELVEYLEQVPAPVVLVAHNGRRFDFPRFVCGFFTVVSRRHRKNST